MASLGLVATQVGTWGPFVFANPDAEAPDLEVALGDLPQVVADNGLDVASLRFHHRVSYEVGANWKIAIENYLECYHCALNHRPAPQFPPVHPDAYTAAAPYDVSDSMPSAQYHVLFPGMKFSESGAAEPVDRPGVAARRRSHGRVARLLLRGGHRRGLDPGVQRGAGSGALEHGRLLARTEELIGAFQDMVRARLS
jgi:phenylpropionate dioxygenase-like ring-hydroxylating dioxygenase large terminal subunit